MIEETEEVCEDSSETSPEVVFSNKFLKAAKLTEQNHDFRSEIKNLKEAEKRRMIQDIQMKLRRLQEASESNGLQSSALIIGH